MYNSYPNNNKNEYNSEQNYNSNTTNNNYTPNEYSQNHTINQNEQSWNTAENISYTTRPAVTYPNAQSKTKKKGKGIKIASIILACFLSSVITLSSFYALISTGIIKFNNSESSNSAFTINKLVSEQTDKINEFGVLSNKAIATKVIPSIVCIQNYQITNNYGFMGASTDNQIGLSSEGSGVIMSDDGYIITNAHVVDGATNLKVVLQDGTVQEATIIGKDNATDLAVIKIDATNLTPAEFGSSDDLSIGDDAIVIGNPGGSSFNSSMTTGVVSALDREVYLTDFGYAMNVIQTDAAISPGNSGGALINRYGQVVGITSSKFVKDGYEGLGFAIPIDDAQPIISNLKEYGYVKDRAMLGIQGQFIDEMTARFNGLTSGMYVAEVSSVNAIKSGLKRFDVITHIDGEQITSQEKLSAMLISKKPGEEVELTVDRAQTGERGMSIKIILSEFTQ